MDDLQAVRHIPQVLQQISLFTFGNADILHIVVKFKVIILPVPFFFFFYFKTDTYDGFRF